ncbi:PTS sugar transporter subunit IIA, partial [Escherichia coli]|nr:PTS sugar transporter subunit IIA [Escherichia coli]
HIEVLAQISTKIIEDGFVEKLKQAQSREETLEMLTDIQTQSNEFLPTSLEFTSEPLSPWAQKLGRIKEHLLFGTSHMI